MSSGFFKGLDTISSPFVLTEIDTGEALFVGLLRVSTPATTSHYVSANFGKRLHEL
jgi:hypothetical protein